MQAKPMQTKHPKATKMQTIANPVFVSVCGLVVVVEVVVSALSWQFL